MWKLVSAKLDKWELYDLDADRTELHDVADKYPRRVARMEKEWFRLAREVDRLGRPALAPVGKQVKELSFRKDTSSGRATPKSPKT